MYFQRKFSKGKTFWRAAHALGSKWRFAPSYTSERASAARQLTEEGCEILKTAAFVWSRCRQCTRSTFNDFDHAA